MNIDRCVGELFQMKGGCLRSILSSGNSYFKEEEFNGYMRMTVYYYASLFCSGMLSTLSLSREVITGMRELVWL